MFSFIVDFLRGVGVAAVLLMGYTIIQQRRYNRRLKRRLRSYHSHYAEIDIGAHMEDGILDDSFNDFVMDLLDEHDGISFTFPSKMTTDVRESFLANVSNYCKERGVDLLTPKESK